MADSLVIVAAVAVVACTLVIAITLCFIVSWIFLYHKHAQYKLDAAAKRREAALSAARPQSAFKVEQMKHAPTYHPEFFDTGKSSGKAFHFDTLLTYTNGNSNQNNNCSNLNTSETSET